MNRRKFIKRTGAYALGLSVPFVPIVRRKKPEVFNNNKKLLMRLQVEEIGVVENNVYKEGKIIQNVVWDFNVDDLDINPSKYSERYTYPAYFVLYCELCRHFGKKSESEKMAEELGLE